MPQQEKALSQGHNLTDELPLNVAVGNGIFQIYSQGTEGVFNSNSVRMAPFWQKLDARSLYVYKGG